MTATAPRQRVAPPRAARARNRTLTYLTVRLTGVLLAVLVLGHFAVVHITTDVAGTNAGFIARRWASALWLTWDWLMLAAAVAHGAAGLWILIDDYAPRGRRSQLHAALTALSAVMFCFGSVLIARAIYT